MSPDEVAQAIAAALEPLSSVIEGLTVHPYYNENPAEPCIDVQAGPVFQQGAGYGVGSKRVWFTVRALVPSGDIPAAHQMLYQLLDPNGSASVEQALAAIDVVVDNEQGEVSGIGTFSDVPNVLGTTWRVGAWIE